MIILSTENIFMCKSSLIKASRQIALAERMLRAVFYEGQKGLYWQSPEELRVVQKIPNVAKGMVMYFTEFPLNSDKRANNAVISQSFIYGPVLYPGIGSSKGPIKVF